MKKLGILLILISLFSLKNVNAENYYTDEGNGQISICTDGKCESVSVDSVIFTIKDDEQIATRDNVDYVFDSNGSIAKKYENNSSENNSTDDESANNDNKGKTTCDRLKEPLKFIGYIVLIVKIVVPLILIIYGILDLFKAVVGGKDGELPKSLKALVMRVIAAVAIFLLPTIINLVFNMVSSWKDVESEASTCQRCILNVNKC